MKTTRTIIITFTKSTLKKDSKNSSHGQKVQHFAVIDIELSKNLIIKS
jgi:hypothetical protein